MTTAERMRKYRARVSLRRALKRARDAGVDVQAVLDEGHPDETVAERCRVVHWMHREQHDVTPIGVTEEGARP